MCITVCCGRCPPVTTSNNSIEVSVTVCFLKTSTCCRVVILQVYAAALLVPGFFVDDHFELAISLRLAVASWSIYGDDDGEIEGILNGDGTGEGEKEVIGDVD
ncbi:hypothetical protein BC941DRAFT_514875 [Chlamydoabsidia padenii]|nr:hypothetical protein BC941DRAFT_514875 [Chlamydoabsidia padenii]